MPGVDQSSNFFHVDIHFFQHFVEKQIHFQLIPFTHFSKIK